MALDGDIFANGPLLQTISGLTPGKKYNLKFYWAATQFQNRVGDTTERLDVSFGGQTRSTATVGGPTHYFAGWFTENMQFTAINSSEVLSFLSIGTPDGLPPVALLDGVSLTAAVPEPATWAMLIAGFGLVGMAARRRGRASFAASN
ncbi:PEPxxWA-CTERM sorting domain-containing protein [Sandaracinobacteroides saxicola]|uniref:PEPxxWA-CTERM sorting domain-containing protein n=2 Tax=Sandaracinobacteroides saxicola TaxID=2759707 RepID=A0A7G5IMH6_9SPHN|nr:PEPxxWA-CTERM sorting domain-containing protein [Sandaracinobacteroides saxicola]